MRELLGPPVLLLLAAVSLWALQNRSDDTAPEPPAAVTTAPATADAPPPATPSQARQETAPNTIAPPPASGEVAASEPAAKTYPRKRSARSARYERAAVAFLVDFARPAASSPESHWWAQVVPHLSLRAVDHYAGTDPQRVPFTKVTGRGVVVPSVGPANLLTAVRVPTDAGDYLVEFETDETGLHVTRVAPVLGAEQ